MYAVVVPRAGEDVAEAMARMRDWLDAQRIEPKSFHVDRRMFRIEFGSESQATMFAEAFGGSLPRDDSSALAA